MDNTTPEHTKYTRFMLFVLAFILLIASIVGYMVSQKMSPSGGASTINLSPRVTPTLVPTLIPYPVKGSLTIKKSDDQPVHVGTPFTLNVYATSSKDTVAGYDVVITYDTETFDVQKIQNKQDAFRIFPYTRPEHLSISATKNLSVRESIRFTDTHLLTFAFMPKKKGTYVFSLKPVGNESAKFVNEAAAVTYPESGDIRLEIE